MTYAMQQDLIDRFGQDELIQLTDRSNTGTVNATVVSRALSDADAEINGYLSARYAIPLASTPEVMVRVASDIARYYLFGDAMIATVKDRYDNAIKLLKGVAAGQVDIGADQLGNKPQTNGAAQFVNGGKVFGRSDTGFL